MADADNLCHRVQAEEFGRSQDREYVEWSR